MGTVGQIERNTQNRIVELFCDTLKYTYLGNWEDRPDNSNIEKSSFMISLENRATVMISLIRPCTNLTRLPATKAGIFITSTRMSMNFCDMA